jgi:hypothetical protein
VVVAVGLTVVEPLAAVEVKVPGAMEMVVAPVTDQVSVLVAPELTLAGLAVKEAITGGETGSEVEFDNVVPQPAREKKAGIKSSAQRFSNPIIQVLRRLRCVERELTDAITAFLHYEPMKPRYGLEPKLAKLGKTCCI